MGRFDGENYNIGLVDICNMPYGYMLDVVWEANERIYGVASGIKKPFNTQPLRIPKIFF